MRKTLLDQFLIFGKWWSESMIVRYLKYNFMVPDEFIDMVDDLVIGAWIVKEDASLVYVPIKWANLVSMPPHFWNTRKILHRRLANSLSNIVQEVQFRLKAGILSKFETPDQDQPQVHICFLHDFCNPNVGWKLVVFNPQAKQWEMFNRFLDDQGLMCSWGVLRQQYQEELPFQFRQNGCVTIVNHLAIESVQSFLTYDLLDWKSFFVLPLKAEDHSMKLMSEFLRYAWLRFPKELVCPFGKPAGQATILTEEHCV